MTLAASMLVTFALGSVHAFSVFIVPLENLLQSPRSEISLIYSLALVALTFAVLLGYRIYALAPAWLLVMGTCLAAAIGLGLASMAKNWWLLFAGYSLVFGFSNGIGYGYCLQLVGRVMPETRGFAMGAVTAAYAVGSIVFAQIFAWRIATESVRSALLTLAVGLVCIALIAPLMLRISRASYGASSTDERHVASRLEHGKVAQFWLAYMASVFAGLMAIGHAAGIALAKGANIEVAIRAAIMIGIGSAFGGFAAGWLVDRWPLRRLLVGLPLMAAATLLVISLASNAGLVVLLLSLVGFSYGAIIAVYPVAIASYFGERGAEAYGRVFTAWGFAGLVAPWSAGLIYDLRGGYELAMIIAALIALISAFSAAFFRLEQATEGLAH
ncbi:MAG: MFS transporter [Gammaproteobacteria bacterium]|nr:MAG: MFS transporter [Gammaproteobacteria bacterium]